MNMASDFAQEYIHLCKERNIEPNDGVLKSLQRPCASPGKHEKGILNLRTCGLDEQTCAVIGKVLSTDRVFEQIDLSDCALSDAAITNIICGLYSNVSCQRLNLKGNNIRGKSTECLGRLLRQNLTIQSMILEWNNVGMLEDAFMVFCEGLSTNSSLVSLDLRNNQISHYGAQELSNALKRNMTLRTLDLRWNSIGLVGGKYLLETFKHNKTIDHIELNGNDIPNDIKQAIDNAARGNKELQNLTDEYSSRTRFLSDELSRTKQLSATQFDDLTCRLDEKEERLRKSNRVASQKIEHFKQLLDERKGTFNTLTSKLSRTESELVLSDQKWRDLEILLAKEREDREATTASYRSELKHTQQNYQITESRLTTEVTSLNDKNSNISQELFSLQQTCNEQKKYIHQLKEQIANLEANARVSASNAQERLKKEQEKHSLHIKELNQQKELELEKARADQSVIENTLRDHIKKLEQQKRDCEEEMSRMKTSLVQERFKHEEELAQTRTKLKSDQDFHIHHMEDKLRLLHQAKDEMSQLTSQQACTVNDLQTKNSSLSMEIDNLKRHIDTLQQGVKAKQHDIDQARHQVQMQLNEKIAELEKEQLNSKTVREKLNKMERDKEEQMNKLEGDLDKRKEEIKHMKDKLSLQEAHILWMREETSQRAQALQNAVRNYAQPLPANMTS